MGLFGKSNTKEPQAKEDFSSLTDLEVIEKIDAYAVELSSSTSSSAVEKLLAAVDEFDKRFNAMPLSKKGTISQSWSFLKVQADNVRQMTAKNMFNSLTNFAVGITGGLTGAKSMDEHSQTMASQISNYASQIYTELSKQ